MPSSPVRSASHVGRPRGRPRILGVFLFALAALGPSSRAVTLATDGRSEASILLAGDATPAEKTAARELASHLRRITGADLPIRAEPSNTPGPRIHVGPTRFAGALGIDASALGPEEWVVRTAGKDLVLCGGRPRGTLYAVYRFLEDHAGVRWWTPYDETVPRRPTLEIGEVDARGEPAFAYRDVHGVEGPTAFRARNRLNGHFAMLSRDYGGTISYGPPHHAHTFYAYLPPDELFDEHPEYFSERDGRRFDDRGQICLTNEAVLDLVTRQLRQNIEDARRAAKSAGAPAPRLFDISHNDWGGTCRCHRCAPVAEKDGGESELLLRFVNAVADAIREDHPDVRIDTLAYYVTFRPPRDVRPRDNVVVRFSGLQWRDFFRPVLAPENREYREAFLGWSRIAPHLRVWDYAVTFGDGRGLPLPNLELLAEDYRFYLEHGVEGMFVQHGDAIAADLRDLKLWVMLKLLEDPRRDVGPLIHEFTEGFYGPAGPHVRRYLGLLSRRARKEPSRVGYPADPEEFRYLDRAFLGRAERTFDRAERAVRNRPTLLRRVRHARMPLDRALLLKWDRRPRRDPARVAARYLETWRQQVNLRVPAARRERELARGEKDAKRLLRSALRRGAR